MTCRQKFRELQPQGAFCSVTLLTSGHEGCNNSYTHKISRSTRTRIQYHGAEKTSLLSTLPEEIIDLILVELDTREDLLAAALTCTKFSEIITWEQINYCYIRVDLVRTKFWEHLAANSRLAACIRHLELYHEQGDKTYTSVLPSRLPHHQLQVLDAWAFESPKQVRRAIRNVVAAIRHMTKLKRFHWHMFDIVPEIFKTVALTCYELKGLAVTDTGVDYLQNELDHKSIFSGFRDLTSFWYRTPSSSSHWGSPTRKHRLQNALRKLLHRDCPLLEDLYLEYEAEGSDEDGGLFKHVYWPRLKRLGVPAELFHDDYDSFVSTHPTLQTLRIGEMDAEEHHFHRLPVYGLKSLEVDRLYSPSYIPEFSPGLVTEQITDFYLSVKTRKPAAPPPLGVPYSVHYIRHHKKPIHGSHSDLRFLTNFSNLQRLVIQSNLPAPTEFETLLWIVPSTIETLIYMGSLPFRATPAPHKSFPPFNPISSLVYPLKKLNHLCYLGFISIATSTYSEFNIYCDQFTSKEAIRCIEIIGGACLSLEQLGLQDNRSKMCTAWCEIERGEEGEYSSYSVVSWSDEEYAEAAAEADSWTAFSDASKFLNPLDVNEYWPYPDEDEDAEVTDTEDSGDGQ